MAIVVASIKKLRHNFFTNYRSLRWVERVVPNGMIVSHQRDILLDNWMALQIAKRNY